MKRAKPQKRGNIITPENYRQFKPSEFIHSFISDIEVAERTGKPMDMEHYKLDDCKPGCLPCLGGTACLNWGFNNPYSEGLPWRVANSGEQIRWGNGEALAYNLRRLYEIPVKNLPKQKPIMGNPNSPKAFQRLKDRVLFYVTALEKQGL